MIKTLIILFIFAISGCATRHKLTYTKFEPFVAQTGEQKFKFFAHSTFFNPSFDKESENERMEWLQMWLTDNSLCKNGYTIVERKEVDLGFGSEVKDIYYTGQCK